MVILTLPLLLFFKSGFSETCSGQICELQEISFYRKVASFNTSRLEADDAFSDCVLRGFLIL